MFVVEIAECLSQLKTIFRHECGLLRFDRRFHARAERTGKQNQFPQIISGRRGEKIAVTRRIWRPARTLEPFSRAPSAF